jgi:hypothetical protein
MLTLALLLATPDAEAMRQAIIARCAIPADRLAVEHWEDSGDVLMVKGSAPLSNRQLDCLGKTLVAPDLVTAETLVSFSFEDHALARRYTTRASRANLASTGQLARLPVFNPRRETLAGFAQRLERFCKAKPGVLVVEEDNIRISDGAFEAADSTPPAFDDPLLCAVNALGASGFDAFGRVPVVPTPVIELPEVTTPAS